MARGPLCNHFTFATVIREALSCSDCSLGALSLSEFLRGMADHHEGLVLMASAAMTKATRPETQGDAHTLHQKQEQERNRMVGMIGSAYHESHTPAAMPNTA